jgi:hypothetical protein
MELFRQRDFVALFMYATEIDTTENYKFEIYTNKDMSENQKIKLQVNYANEHSWEDNSASSHPRDTRQKSQWQNEKLEQLRQQLYKLYSNWYNADITGAQVTLKFDGQKPAKYQANFVMGSSQVSNDQRFIAQVYANGIKYNKEFNVQASLYTPNVPELNLNDALKSQEDGKMKIVAEYGDAGQQSKKAKVTFKANMAQSDERRRYVEQLEEAQECKRQMKQGNYVQSECREAIYQAQIYDQYAFSVEYENLSKEFRQACEKYGPQAQSYFDFYLYSNLVNQQDRDKSNYQVEFRLSPDFESCNITLMTPMQQTRYEDIELPSYAVRYIASHPEYSYAQRFAYYATNDAYYGKQ